MEVGRGRCMAVLLALVAVVVVVLDLSLVAAGSATVERDRRPCFDACFDQCVPRDEFWFCQFSCYHWCGRGLGCERSCVLNMCGQLRPGSKMMAACIDTCRKGYAVAACSGGTNDVV